MAELRRLLTSRLSLTEVGVVWFDLSKEVLHDHQQGAGLQRSVIALLDLVEKRRQFPALFQWLRDNRPDLESDLPSLSSPPHSPAAPPVAAPSATSALESSPISSNSNSRASPAIAAPSPASNGIVLLHLSDLHFGNKNRFEGRDLADFGRQFAVAVENARKELGWDRTGRPIDVVIVSGDIAEVARPAEFDQGATFLGAAFTGLNVPVHRVVFVPGNHDVSWPRCRIVDSQRDEDGFSEEEYARRITEAKLVPYNNFLRSFYGITGEKDSKADLTQMTGRTLLDRAGDSYLHDFRINDHLPLSIAALNTCERETHKAHGGELGRSQAEALMRLWRSPEYALHLKVVVVHHNPTVTSDANRRWTEEYEHGRIEQPGHSVSADWLGHYTADMAGFRGAENLRLIVKDVGAQLVLHGHHHSPLHPETWLRGGRDGGIAPVLSVGSFGLKAGQVPPDQPLTCQLISFQVSPTPRLIAVPLRFDPTHRLEGELDRGQFRLDLLSESRYDQPLPLPEAWPKLPILVTSNSDISATSGRSLDKEKPDLDHFSNFLGYYRGKLAHLHSAYDLKNLGVALSDISRTVDPKLDDLYLPLRFDEKFNIDKTDQGRQLDVNALVEYAMMVVSSARIKASRPEFAADFKGIAITGVAGAGKTTWMRYTFRRMLSDPRTLPFLIELRAVAKFWADHQIEPRLRSIEAYLEAWLSEYAAEFRDRGIKRVSDLLEANDVSWRPILLVDGWDELGELGNKFRSLLLGMLTHCPRLLVVASSRPYGEGRLNHGDGFRQFQVQPLSPDEVATFAHTFYARCYGEDESAARKQGEEFGKALERSSDAHLLARTPLLLTMMLFINRSRHLPDRRHELYRECLSSLLDQRVRDMGKDGTHMQVGEWCPPGGAAERLQIVARMAYAMQANRNLRESFDHRSSAVPILVSKDKLREYLPTEWNRNQKDGFVLWLCGRAGILSDDTDDNYSFIHLSFQEFLTAWHLKNMLEGSDTETKFKELSRESSWWETLLLWAALRNDENPERARDLLATVVQEGNVLLAGMMLADGVGTEVEMQEWIGAFWPFVRNNWPTGMERCLRSWQASRQRERRSALILAIRNEAGGTNWLSWLRAERVLRAIGETEPLLSIRDPESALQAPLALLQFGDAGDEPVTVEHGGSVSHQQFAGGRSAIGAGVFFPLFPESLLQLWPSQRRRVGLHLQRILSLEGDRNNILTALHRLQQTRNNHARALAIRAVRSMDRFRDQTPGLADGLSIDHAHALALDLACDHASTCDHALNIDLIVDRALVLNFSRDRKIHTNHEQIYFFAREDVGALDSSLAHNSELTLDCKAGFVMGYLAGSSTLRTYLANQPSGEIVFPAIFDPLLFDLLARAARISVEYPTLSSTVASHKSFILVEDFLERARERARRVMEGDRTPVWIALARHVARLSTDEDRNLLTQWAAEPSLAGNGNLSWGLQYIVRGDILLPDGSEITLDELCDEIGVEHYPLLEEMPPELNPAELR